MRIPLGLPYRSLCTYWLLKLLVSALPTVTEDRHGTVSGGWVSSHFVVRLPCPLAVGR